MRLSSHWQESLRRGSNGQPRRPQLTNETLDAYLETDEQAHAQFNQIMMALGGERCAVRRSS